MQAIEKHAARIFVAMLLAAMAGSASAQQPVPRPPATRAQAVQAQPAQSDVPQRTTASYADWVVQCDTQEGPPLQKVCDMEQIVQVQQQGRNVPFSRISVAHPVRGQPVKLLVQVPVSVSLATNVRIQTSDADPGITAPFARCVPTGCFADFEIKEEVLKKLRAASGSGKLSFAEASGHEINVPLSFNGFSQAFEALARD